MRRPGFAKQWKGPCHDSQNEDRHENHRGDRAALFAGRLAADALTSVLAQQAVFGFDQATGNLRRYDFASGTLKTVGLVQASGTTLTGINGAAYNAGFNNIYAFWTDPATNLTHLAYVNTQNAQATLMGQDQGTGWVTGASSSALGNNQYGLYAAQQIQPQDITVPFSISGDNISPSATFAAKITVLGAAISYSGQYDMPVTVRLKVGSTTLDPFGDFNNAVVANVNDNKNPRNYILPSTYAAGTNISVLGQSWEKKNSGVTGKNPSDWVSYMSVDGSGTATQQIPRAAQRRRGAQHRRLHESDLHRHLRARLRRFHHADHGALQEPGHLSL